MSRVGKQIINIPDKTEVTLQDGVLTVKGPLGTLTRNFKDIITITIADKIITLAPKSEDVKSRALWGTYASHILNMIEGVTKGFEKKMTIEGVGYKVNVNGSNFVLDIGLSHQVIVPIPEGIKAVTEKNNFSISGIDKEKVGEFAAKIRAYKKTELTRVRGYAMSANLSDVSKARSRQHRVRVEC